jgi:hypothetical protein
MYCDLFVTLTGNQASSKVPLSRVSDDAFVGGSASVFLIECPLLGSLQRIIIHVDNVQPKGSHSFLGQCIFCEDLMFFFICFCFCFFFCLNRTSGVGSLVRGGDVLKSYERSLSLGCHRTYFIRWIHLPPRAQCQIGLEQVVPKRKRKKKTKKKKRGKAECPCTDGM